MLGILINFSVAVDVDVEEDLVLMALEAIFASRGEVSFEVNLHEAVWVDGRTAPGGEDHVVAAVLRGGVVVFVLNHLDAEGDAVGEFEVSRSIFDDFLPGFLDVGVHLLGVRGFVIVDAEFDLDVVAVD